MSVNHDAHLGERRLSENRQYVNTNFYKCSFSVSDNIDNATKQFKQNYPNKYTSNIDQFVYITTRFHSDRF